MWIHNDRKGRESHFHSEGNKVHTDRIILYLCSSFLFYFCTIRPQPLQEQSSGSEARQRHEYLLLPSRWSCVTKPRDTMKASFCGREVKEEHTSVWVLTKPVTCSYWRLQGKASPTGCLLEGGQAQAAKSGAPPLLAAMEPLCSFPVLQGPQEKAKAYIFYFLDDRNQRLEWPKFLSILLEGRGFHIRKAWRASHVTPNAKGFPCHN